MRTASFARHQRLFGQRDWPAGEPYMVGERQLGVVTPEGAVDFNRYAMFSEPTGEAWRDAVEESERRETQLLSDVGEIAVFLGIVFLAATAAYLLVLIEAGL